ncbi:HicB-like antitoxin [Mycobacterium phage Kevin1]|uniref:Uncharacterized protein n=1 Tax=Mycobacterium phage Kevin1 TaxID=2530132 RepID=A0A481VUE0_9CAUD|nr:HicB-like antitoxin [Mycobacterium phage Kevin1]QBI97275.1 hypothetical protein SEA_KEVIN1_31 [Mycobacterium phage Kevin1]
MPTTPIPASSSTFDPQLSNHLIVEAFEVARQRIALRDKECQVVRETAEVAKKAHRRRVVGARCRWRTQRDTGAYLAARQGFGRRDSGTLSEPFVFVTAVAPDLLYRR